MVSLSQGAGLSQGQCVMLYEPRSFSRGFVRGIPAAALALLLSCGLAQAHHHRHYRASFARGVSLTDPQKDAALIVDGSSGKVLYARNPDVPRHPASLTKMMTLYLLFDALKQGKVTLATSLWRLQKALEERSRISRS